MIVVVPVTSDWARPVLLMRGDRGCSRGPGHLRRQVGGCPVGVGAGGRELLVRPLAMVGLAGATAIEVSAAAVTVSVSAGLVTPPRVAVIVVVPVTSDWARPVLLMRGDRGCSRRPGHLAWSGRRSSRRSRCRWP